MSASERDIPKIFAKIMPDGTGITRAAASVEDLARAAPIPHDVQMQQIVDGINERQELENPDRASVRYAWRHFRAAHRALWRSFGHWFGLKRCQMFWHDPSTGFHGNKICRRCGAWKE